MIVSQEEWKWNVISKIHSSMAKIRSWNKRRLRTYRNLTSRLKTDRREPLCVIAIVKNEELNITEWIDHYLWQGVNHIFIIDNGSTDSTMEMIRNHPYHHAITLYHLPRKHRQAEHYRFLFRKENLKSRYRWLVIADGDEFWFGKTGNTLREALLELDAFDLVYCNWKIFGTSGFKQHPTSLRLQLTKCMPKLGPHALSKWAVKTDAIRNASSIGVHKVGECRSTHTITEHETIQINHYVTQSEQFWREVKMKRGDAWGPQNDATRDQTMFDTIELECSETDEGLAKLLIVYNERG